MTKDGVSLSEEQGRVDIAHPVEMRLRRLVGGGGAAAIVAALGGWAMWRPSVFESGDAMLLFGLAATATIGAALLSFALYGGEWVISFEAATGTVRRELRTFGNLAMIDGFVFEDLSGLCAVRDRDRDGDGEEAYRLFMIEAENGRPLHLGDFTDEGEMRAAARAINSIHRGLRVG